MFSNARFTIHSLTLYLVKRFQRMFDKRNSLHFLFVTTTLPWPVGGKFVLTKAVSQAISGYAIQRELRAIYFSEREQ